jgi:hypothetical protein
MIGHDERLVNGERGEIPETELREGDAEVVAGREKPRIEG